MDRKSATAKVNEDGQIVIEVTDPFGTERTVLSRKVSREIADKLIEVQSKT